jgi:hypothetical protein
MAKICYIFSFYYVRRLAIAGGISFSTAYYFLHQGLKLLDILKSKI